MPPRIPGLTRAILRHPEVVGWFSEDGVRDRPQSPSPPPERRTGRNPVGIWPVRRRPCLLTWGRGDNCGSFVMIASMFRSTSSAIVSNGLTPTSLEGRGAIHRVWARVLVAASSGPGLAQLKLNAEGQPSPERFRLQDHHARPCLPCRGGRAACSLGQSQGSLKQTRPAPRPSRTRRRRWAAGRPRSPGGRARTTGTSPARRSGR